MFRRIIVLITVFLLGFSAFGIAGEVSLERAREVAENWLYHCTTTYEAWSEYTTPDIVSEEIMEYNNQVVGYNFLIYPKGHIVVPSRNELPPVKLYSDTSTLVIAEDSDIAQWIIEELFKINEALDAHYKELEGIDCNNTINGKLWALFEVDSYSFAEKYEQVADKVEFETYGPLLSTAWYQGDPYNMYCPLYNGSSTYTGCVATAAAQVMKYHNHPTTGKDSTSYSWWNGSSYQTLSQDFSTSVYNWSSMTNTYSGSSSTTAKQAVGRLMSDIGIAYHMNYGTSGSSASTMDGKTVFPDYFNYKSTISAVYRTEYASDSAWMNVFKGEVQNNRPCTFRIKDPSAGGHSVVVDGYRDSPSEQIHINMGWAGSYDGWYASNNIVTGSYDWSDVNYQGAVIGIEPALSAPTGVSATDGTHTDKVRVTWNSVSGATSYKVYCATSSGGSKTSLGSTSSTTYDDTSATPGWKYYYYWVKASTSSEDSDYSAYNTGWRKPLPPTITAGSATSVTSSSATLNGTVNPNGANTTYYCQLGRTAYSDPFRTPIPIIFGQ